MNIKEEIMYNSDVLEEANERLFKIIADKAKSLENVNVSPLTKVKFKNAIESGDYERIEKITKRAIKEQISNSFEDNRSFVEKLKDLFSGGWENAMESLKTNNYDELAFNPLVQIVVAIGGAGLIYKFIKAIRKKKNEKL